MNYLKFSCSISFFVGKTNFRGDCLSMLHSIYDILGFFWPLAIYWKITLGKITAIWNDDVNYSSITREIFRKVHFITSNGSFLEYILQNLWALWWCTKLCILWCLQKSCVSSAIHRRSRWDEEWSIIYDFKVRLSALHENSLLR